MSGTEEEFRLVHLLRTDEEGEIIGNGNEGRLIFLLGAEDDDKYDVQCFGGG